MVANGHCLRPLTDWKLGERSHRLDEPVYEDKQRESRTTGATIFRSGKVASAGVAVDSGRRAFSPIPKLIF